MTQQSRMAHADWVKTGRTGEVMIDVKKDVMCKMVRPKTIAKRYDD